MSGLPRFLLLDLDDTLLDYSASGRCCWRDLCGEYAPRFGVNAEQLRISLSQSSSSYWSDPERHRRGRLDLKAARRDVLRLTLQKLGLEDFDLGDEMADAFTVQREELVAPFPGAVETLHEFQQRGIRMGLITNGSSAFQRNKIRRFDLARYFEAILIEGEFDAGKPDRRIFLSALQALEAQPAQTWMVGDDLERDIQPSAELGLGTVWVDFDRKGLEPGSPVIPCRIVHSVTELKALG